MRTRLLMLSLVGVLVFGLALAAAFNPTVNAQDEMAPHVCDSTTILLLFIAEYEYGYAPMMDISTFELGQYAPLFELMMGMMESGEMEMMSEEEMAEMMEMGENMEMDEDMTLLTPLTIADEDPACTELRTSVENFLYLHFLSVTSEMMGEESGG